MVEFAIVLLLSRVHQKRNHEKKAKNKSFKAENSTTRKNLNKTISINNLEAPSSCVSESEVYSVSKEKWYSTTDVIDCAAFFIFFFSYLTFNFAYMSYHI